MRERESMSREDKIILGLGMLMAIVGIPVVTHSLIKADEANCVKL